MRTAMKQVPKTRTAAKATAAKPVAKATSVGVSMEMWRERPQSQSTLQGSSFKHTGSSTMVSMSAVPFTAESGWVYLQAGWGYDCPGV
jgi:hypothetical protein